jgi:hypothetical protein
MNQSPMFKPALIGGVLLGVLTSLPVVNCLCCVWVIGAGVVASYLYIKSSPVTVTLGTGILLGLLTGIIGAIVGTLFAIPLHLLYSRLGMGLGEQARQFIEQFPSLPPEARDALRTLASRAPNIGLLIIVLSGIFNLVLYSLMAMLGGAIGVALFEKRKLGGDAQTPPPPYQAPPEPPQDLP